MGPDLFYECQRCRAVLPSMPKENVNCICYNMGIDVDAGRFASNNDSLIKLLRITPE